MMKKLSMLVITLIAAGMLTACGNPAPTAELDYNGGEENIVVENVIEES